MKLEKRQLQDLLEQIIAKIQAGEMVLVEVCEGKNVLSIYYSGFKLGSFSTITDTLQNYLKKIIKTDFTLTEDYKITRSGKAYLIGASENLITIFKRK
jgi:hypothetical protein